MKGKRLGQVLPRPQAVLLAGVGQDGGKPAKNNSKERHSVQIPAENDRRTAERIIQPAGTEQRLGLCQAFRMTQTEMSRYYLDIYSFYFYPNPQAPRCS